MKSSSKIAALVLLGTLTFTGAASAEGFPRFVGTYLVDIEIDTVGQFECEFLLDLGFLETCTGKIVLTLRADGTMESNDTSDYRDGFNAAALGNWRRSGFRSLDVSGKTLSLAYDADGVPETYLVRELSLQFSQDRISFGGTSSTRVFGFEQDPLDPTAEPQVVVTATLSGREFR